MSAITIAGTGHRPSKLGVANPYSLQVYSMLIAVATKAIEVFKPTHVISGGALGWDQALIDAARNSPTKIHITAALPFPGFESRWPSSSQTKLRSLLKDCDEVVTVSQGGYSARAMQARNEYMVDRADRMVALWNGELSGGTYNCLKYARDQGVLFTNCWKAWQGMIEANS